MKKYFKKITSLDVSKVNFKKAVSIGMTLCVLCCMCVCGASAAGTDEVVTLTPDAAISAASGLFSQITQTINFANIAKVLGIGLGAVLGIWLAWWGIRKLFTMLQGVIKGKNIKM